MWRGEIFPETNLSPAPPPPPPRGRAAASPFTQSATAIVDSSGSVKLINNAGSILANTTLQTPGANATVINNTQAINLLAGTTGGTVVNNSGIIVGDVLFNSGGGGNKLNVGN